MIDQDKMRAIEQTLRDRHAYVFSITNPKYRDAASKIYEEAADAIDLLLAEVEAAAADKRDAERYRFLRHADLDELAAANWKDGQVYEGEALDAAIDAALAQRQGEGS